MCTKLQDLTPDDHNLTNNARTPGHIRLVCFLTLNSKNACSYVWEVDYNGTGSLWTSWTAAIHSPHPLHFRPTPPPPSTRPLSYRNDNLQHRSVQSVRADWDYRLDYSEIWVRFPTETDILIFSTASRPALGHTQPPIQRVSDTLSPEVKLP
jgi:hypothetical protein